MSTEFILYIATSLDGYIARSDGSLDWLPDPDSVGENSSYPRFYASIDAVIMGATTYEQVLGFGDWAYPDKTSYVLTNRDLASDRSDVFFIQGGLDPLLAEINRNGHQRVWVVGGGQVASLFMQRNLIDEYIITIIPTILGSGISLYQSVPELKLELLGTKTLALGMVEIHYRTTTSV